MKKRFGIPVRLLAVLVAFSIVFTYVPVVNAAAFFAEDADSLMQGNAGMNQADTKTESGENDSKSAFYDEVLKFEGKTVSILSASTSTYAGVSNNTTANSTIGKNDVYYTEGRHGVYLKDTWWQQVIDALDMRLLVNNSWSGSCVFQPRKGAASIGYEDRAVNLHNDHTGEEPDIIWVYIGCNDFAYFKDTFGQAADVDYSALIKDNGDGTFDYTVPTTTCEAYAIMLHKIQTRYPDAEVYCFTTVGRRDPDYAPDNRPDTGQPTEYSAELIQVAEHFACTVIDWENCIPKEAELFDKYIADKRAHPNAEGMDLMSQAAISGMLGKETTLYDVSGTYTGVEIDNTAAAAIEGMAYQAKLTAGHGSTLDVTVTMGGVDVTSSVYSDGTIYVETVTGDIEITAKASREMKEFRWEVVDGHLASAGEDENLLTALTESITDGVIIEGKYQFAIPVILKHDQPWVMEWKCAGDWRGILLATDLAANVTGRSFLARTKGGQLIIGTWDGKQNHNYGVDLSKLDAQSHTYRLENRIAADGSNMVWLYLDGAEIGPMNNYFIGSKDQNTTSDWINGKDFVFPYIGMDTTPVTNCQLDYLAVTECDHTYENGICTACGAEHPALANYKGKVISILSASTSTFAGYIPTADGFNLAHRPRYPQDDLLTNVNDTWWMQVIHALNAKLGINDSWAGSTVSNFQDTNSGDMGPDACMASLTRIQNLSSNGTPDVILFFGAGNDMGRGVTLGSFDPATAPTEVDLTASKWDSFADAYVAAIMRLQHFYPDAEIIVMTTYAMPSYVTTAKLDKYGPVIQAICDHYGVRCIDLRNCGVTYEMLPDKIHPNAEGMDHITDAVLDTLVQDVAMVPGDNAVYSVTHNLTNAEAGLHYYKGVSHGAPFIESVSGKNVSVTVTMGGVNITDQVYANGTITIPEVTGDLVITAKGAFDANGHLQQLPEQLCAGTNLWTALEPENIYYTANGWGLFASSPNVHSITFPVKEGDRIWATSMQAVGENGNTANATRITWFISDGSVLSLDRNTVYDEFSANGFVTAPKGAIALNLPSATGERNWEVYILNRDHSYTASVTPPTCTQKGYTTYTCACGDSYVADYVDELGHYHATADVLADGESLTLTDHNVVKNYKALIFSADVEDLGQGLIRLSHGQKAYSGNYIEITAETVRVYSTYAQVSMNEYVHGLTIDGTVRVRIETARSSTKLTISTESGTFSKSISWSGSNGELACGVSGATLKHVDLRWYALGVESDYWFFGDSWFSTNSSARWTKYLLDDGYTDVLLGGYGGMGAPAGLKQFRELLQINTPKFAVWALGMNNGDRSGKINAGWLTATEEFLALCQEYGVTPILCTIPHTPKVNNLYKNEWIRESGWRYIDFNLAVVENHSTGDWFEGMAASDLAHPTQLGAQTLYPQVFVDFPELAAGDPATCSHKLHLLGARGATCEIGGREAYYVCSLCAGTYRDAEAKEPVTNAEMHRAPTGHSMGDWVAVSGTSPLQEQQICATCTHKSTRTLQSITVTTKPSKLTYLEGEAFSATGMVIIATFSDNGSRVITDYTVSGYDSAPGEKTITVAYGGRTATFTVTVKARVPDAITSDTYSVVSGQTIGKIAAGTTVSQLLAGINRCEYVKVFDKSGKEVSAAASVGTGMTVKLLDGDTVKDSVTVVVTGDTNGDGAISVTDMVAIKSDILNKDKLSGVYAIAADTNGDGKLSVTDFLQVKAHILGKGAIQAR